MATTSNPTPRRKSSAGHVFAIIGKVLGTILLVGILTCAIMACFAAVYIKTVILPETHLDLTLFETKLSSTIYYTDKATGQPVELQALHGSENRVWVTYDQIPENLVNAAVAIEDKRFWEHNGVDWGRTAYGVLSMFTGRDIQGGSTITQQLIKNMTQDNEVTVKRKIQEIFRALELDRNYDKKIIMEYYLNYIYFGKGCYGVATAAEVAGNLVSDGDGGADFAGEFAVGVGFDGDGDFHVFYQAEFFQDENVGVVFVGVFLDVFKGDVDGGKAAVKGVFYAFDEVGFVV